MFPSLPKLLSFKITDQSVEDFIINVVTKNVEYREQNDINSNDFFQLLIQIRNSGVVKENRYSKIEHNETNEKLTIEELAAQTFIFFAAGFETSATTMTYLLYELAKHPKYQERVQAEIDTVLAKHNGQITHDSVHEMTFLENCIDGKYNSLGKFFYSVIFHYRNTTYVPTISVTDS